MPSSRIPAGPGVGWGLVSVWKSMGVCCWPLKIGPKKIEAKREFGAERSQSVRTGSFSTPKDRFGVGEWEKVPQKDRVQAPECQKRGSKWWHIHIIQHRGSIHDMLGDNKLCIILYWCRKHTHSWPWRYRSRSKVITCNTRSHVSDQLYQIWN